MRILIMSDGPREFEPISDMTYLRVVTAEQKSRLDEAIWVNPRRMSGTPCFRGARVPVPSLMDFLESAQTIDDFLKLYPPITRHQVLAVSLTASFSNARPHCPSSSAA